MQSALANADEVAREGALNKLGPALCAGFRGVITMCGRGGGRYNVRAG